MYGFDLVRYQIHPEYPNLQMEFMEENGEWSVTNSSTSDVPWSMNKSQGLYQMSQVKILLAVA